MVSTAVFLPNILDYCRLALLMLATTPLVDQYASILCYIVSDVLDLVDGAVARSLRQQSVFGNCLDMITDRIASTILVMHIASCNQQLFPLAAFLMLVDILSHWLRHVCGYLEKVHHKQLVSSSRLLNFYYGNKIFLAFECLAYEGSLISWLALSRSVWTHYARLVFRALILPAALKVWISLVQLWESARFMCCVRVQ